MLSKKLTFRISRHFCLLRRAAVIVTLIPNVSYTALCLAGKRPI